MKLFNKTKREKGSALLIAILMSTVVLAVGFGVYQRTYKEILFSSLWRQTQVAFSAADAGLECAIYRDLHAGVQTCFGLPDFAWGPFVSGTPWTTNLSVGTGCANIKVTKIGTNPVAAGTIIGTYNVGTSPTGVAFDSVRNTVWIANSGNANVTKLDAATGALIGTYSVGSTPSSVVYDSNQSAIWVANFGGNSVTKLDAATGSLIGTYPVGNGPVSIAYDATNNAIWVVNNTSRDLSQLDAASGGNLALITPIIFSSPVSIAFDNVTNSVWVVDRGKLRVVKVPILGGLATNYIVGTTASGDVFDSSTQSIWVTNSGSANVTKVNVNTGVRANFTVGAGPINAAFDSLNNAIWVVNKTDNTITELDAATPSPAVGTYAGAPGPFAAPLGIAFDPTNSAVWFTDNVSNTVTKMSVGVTGSGATTTIEARGYNDACGSTNPRRVERGLRITY